MDLYIDKTTTEKEVISIKVIENGTPRIRLLGIVEPDTCDAQGILKAVAQKCEENQLNLSNCLTATAADGASIHFGKTTGVLTRLQQQSAPWMIKVHCIPHRLELCLKDAFKETYFTQVKNTLNMKNSIAYVSHPPLLTLLPFSQKMEAAEGPRRGSSGTCIEANTCSGDKVDQPQKESLSRPLEGGLPCAMAQDAHRKRSHLSKPPSSHQDCTGLPCLHSPS
ncbi:uncharacterized protein LOC117555554 isoform X2 [Gymnodraco acuticeps]|uniref:Uncharacterized protein LOC117555554 isoform X2 n=1 Tax=Gymnodraco acuticeps TaxID=8218 RepID=A0A6P8VKV7_GYMAC|nr:uncharacterized protein LOC117555554 isoform X2 [Gymnodraco acuticeps]